VDPISFTAMAVTAPLQELLAALLRALRHLDVFSRVRRLDGGHGAGLDIPDPILGLFGTFLRFGSAFCLIVIIAGFWFISKGNSGDVSVKGAGLELKTGTVGLGMVGLGLIFYLLIGALIVKMHRNPKGPGRRRRTRRSSPPDGG
jgi:hypothetical protein